MQPTKTNGAPGVSSLAFMSDISKGVKGGQDLFTPSSSIAICRPSAFTEGKFLESGGRPSAWDAGPSGKQRQGPLLHGPCLFWQIL